MAKSPAEGAVRLSGSIVRPEAEKGASHGPVSGREEASVAPLGNRASSLAHSTERTSGADDRAAPPAGLSEGEGGDADDDEEEEPDTHYTLIRATTRFALDLRKLTPLSSVRIKGAQRELSPEEKGTRQALLTAATLSTSAKNLAMRALVRRDSALFDEYMVKHNEPPRGRDVLYPKAYSYALIRKAFPSMASGMAAAIGREVDRKWVSERWEVLFKQTKSPPHYRLGQPFPIRAQDTKWTWDPEGKYASVTVILFSGQKVNAYRLPLIARDAHQVEILKNLASGDWKAGEVRIERDRLQPAKWYARIAYKRRVEKRTEGQVAAVNRGMSCFLVLLTQKGESLLYDGADIQAHLAALQRRRRSYQRGVKMSGRTGRGRPHALSSIEHLIDKGTRWRQTKCQVIARRAAQWLADRGVRLVYLDDFANIRNALPESLMSKDPGRRQWLWERIQEWPYYQLGQRLASCLQEYGIEVVTQDPAGNSVHCPECHYESPDNVNLRHHMLVCTNPARSHGEGGRRSRPGCGYRRHLDVAFCKNVLQRASGDPAYKKE